MAVPGIAKEARSLGRKPRIGIVGAGLAGLRCGDVLLRHGFDVTILEGRDRVGGRVCQRKLANGFDVDLGPNWIHGTEDNPILDLAKKTNTVVGNWDNTSNIFSDAGILMPQEQGEKHAEIMWSIVQDAFQYSNKYCSEIDPKVSLLDFFQEKIVEKVPESAANFEETRKTVLQMSHMWGAFVGSPVTSQSLKYFWLEECIDGENLFCAGTYRKILDYVAAPALRDATIHYNTTVTKICRKKQNNCMVKLETSSGESFQFDCVVLTVPLGWLKRNQQSAFVPPLPGTLSVAIDAIGYGCLEKVYISFPKPFWLDGHEETKKTKGFVQWIRPAYAGESNPKRWNQELVELASIDSKTAHPTLLFYIYGDQSRYVAETLAGLNNDRDKEAFLDVMFKPYYSRLPNYIEHHESCKPVELFATEWLNDDLAGNGSYGNFQVGLDDGDKAIEAMRAGLPQEGLWLAGEHTAPFVALGTATGAYWSGELVGEHIARAYDERQLAA